MTWGDVAGHLSYAILAISYMLTNVLWLRILACVGIFLEIIYFAASGTAMVTGILWGVVFIAINLYQLHVLLRDRRALNVTSSEKAFLRRLFPELDDGDLVQILRAGAWRNIDQDEILTTLNKPVDTLYLIHDGRIEVRVNDIIVTYLRMGEVVGEISFLSGSLATATTKAALPTRVLALNHAKLSALFARDGRIANAFYQILGNRLAHKFSTQAEKLANTTGTQTAATSAPPAKRRGRGRRRRR
jgi:CRP-like cAMP-binding protein